VWIYLNDRFVPEAEALVSVFDHGFLYGDGVYETIRSYADKLFMRDQHLARLRRSADAIGLTIPARDWPSLLHESMVRNGVGNDRTDAYIRVTDGRWDCDGFEAQTASFVTGTADGIVNFGYVGQRTADIARGITVDHVRWFHRIAGQLREHQLVEALAASGATPVEQTRFARALLARIDQLGSVSVSGATTRSPAGDRPGAARGPTRGPARRRGQGP